MSEDDMQDIDISSPGGRGKNSNPFMHSGGVDGPAAGGGDSVYVDLDSEGVQRKLFLLQLVTLPTAHHHLSLPFSVFVCSFVRCLHRRCFSLPSCKSYAAPSLWRQ